VKNLAIDAGRVSFTIELATFGAPWKEQMREDARKAVAALPGVSNVAVDMAAVVRSTTSADPAGKAPVPGVKNIIAVGAGKGGVGKTTVAVNLAIALSQMGARVAMIDGDIYGPNVPLMLGIKAQLAGDEAGKIIPAEQYGIKLVSMAFMAGDDAPVIWRGPMLHSVIQQFFREVRWENIDYLIVDMPPGTGDIALSLSQTVPVSGSVVVTTPQIVSVADTRRAVRMYQKLNVTPLGLVENMSHFVCPDCRHESDIFGKGGGEALATELSIPFLGRVPIYEPIRIGGDVGVPITIGERTSPASEAFHAAARQLAVQLSIASYKKTAIPLMPVR
jgi:ATP-binding protein involved in chromosome partitioning